MIDLHTHILPGLDDGAESLEVALEMARVAWEDGVTVICATPHSSQLPVESRREGVCTRLRRVEECLARERIDLSLVPGIENAMALELPRQLEGGQSLRLGNSPYLLVELPIQQYLLYTEDVLFELQLKGFCPIIAHPERNHAFQEDASLLCRLVERGILAQVTAASLLGGFGGRIKEVAEHFVQRNLVQIIASDAHTVSGLRSPILSTGVAAAARLVGREKALAMVITTPRDILDGRPIDVEPPISGAPRKGWLFWRR